MTSEREVRDLIEQALAVSPVADALTPGDIEQIAEIVAEKLLEADIWCNDQYCTHDHG